MIARGSTVTRAEARANLQEYTDAVHYFLREGYSINSDLLKASFSISGVFTSEEDSFDASRHKLNVNLLLGADLKEIPSQVKVYKATPRYRYPRCY